MQAIPKIELIEHTSVVTCQNRLKAIFIYENSAFIKQSFYGNTADKNGLERSTSKLLG